MVKLIGYLIVSLLATAKMVAANNDTIFYETQALNSEAIGLNEPASIPTPNTTALANMESSQHHCILAKLTFLSPSTTKLYVGLI